MGTYAIGHQNILEWVPDIAYSLSDQLMYKYNACFQLPICIPA